MFNIKSMDIIPSYMCNLNCEFCLTGDCDKTLLLDLKLCEKVFKILKAEENSLEFITIYGGEVMLLDTEYLKDLILLCKSYFPDAILGAISNLIFVNEAVLRLFTDLNVCISTSYDSLRFMNKPYVLKSWIKNYSALRDLVRDILIIATPYVRNDVRFLEKIISLETRIHVYQLIIPSVASKRRQSFIASYVLSPDEYVQTLRYLRCIYGDNIFHHNSISRFMFNHIHLLPEGIVSIAGPCYEKGYPYEKMYEIWNDNEDTITFSRRRLDYIQKQLSYCLPCDFHPERCYAEYFYPDCCLGEKRLFFNHF